MIHKIAVNLSSWCKKILGMEEAEKQVVQYGLEVLLDGFIKIAILLTIGYFLGCLGEFGLSLLAFCSLRYWAGGVHCQTSLGCLAAMLLLCLISTYGGKYFGSFPEMILGIMTILIYIILLCFAPGLTKKSLDMSNEQMHRKRFGALVWVTIEYVTVMVVENIHLKWCIVIAITIEVFSIIPCWKEQKRRRRNLSCSTKKWQSLLKKWQS